uniref:Uncharacterized protein n=1 Tax=Solanum lycopersicum TaxID=4081 RepID=A0A3Q7H6H7_SOLLC
MRFPKESKGNSREQGIANSALFTSKGMPTIPKNSIDLEKENKQTNPSAYASTNVEIVQEDPSLSCIEIVEKCCGPQTHCQVFGFGGGVKAKDLKDGTSSKAELLYVLRST